MVRLQHENQLLKMQSSSDENSQLLRSMLDDANTHKHELECQVRYCVPPAVVYSLPLVPAHRRELNCVEPVRRSRKKDQFFKTQSTHLIPLVVILFDVISCISLLALLEGLSLSSVNV